MSRALGGYGYVSEGTKRKVLEAAAQLKYSPHVIAKSMVTGRTSTVGLVVGDIENPFFASLAQGVSQTITPEGYHLIVSSTNESPIDERRALERLYERQVDGLIVSRAAKSDGRRVDELTQRGVPVVLVDRPRKGLAVDFVGITNSEGAYEAVQYLVRKGHRRIGFLGDAIETTLERLDGYRRALQEAGIPTEDALVRLSPYSVESAYRHAVAFLNDRPRPTAVFAASNFMTTGLLMAIKDLKVNVPEELAVIGFDDMDWLKLVNPAITAVAQPVYELGRVAAQHLLRRMAGDTRPHESTRLSTHLVVRDSSG